MMLSHAEISERITQFINEEILDGQAVELSYTSPLMELAVLDSFAMVMLLSFIGSQFGVKVDLSSINEHDFESVATITLLVERLKRSAIPE
jgi:acyl carrier protein